MFDIGWTELLVIAVVAVIVVGPKDLPRMLRSFGRTMGQVRRMSNDFRRQFDEALREAERESGLDETRKDLQSIAKSNPIMTAQKDLDKTLRSPASPPASEAKPAAEPKPTEMPSQAPEAASAEAHVAEPLKAGAVSKSGNAA